MYRHEDIDKKWQEKWDELQVFRALDPAETDKKPFYYLVEFPFPSGAGLHVGHPRSYTALDVMARKRRSEGYNVLYPMGWDAFGLPAEQYAIKTGNPPAQVTAENIENFKRQLKSIGLSFDWSREVNTTDPAYYKWTQWMFLEFYRAGLAYVDERMVWWCDELGTVLANEEVIDGKSERGGFPCVRKPMRQWMLEITRYADSLLEGLDDTEFLPQVEKQQRDWIGKSEGAEIEFGVEKNIPESWDGIGVVLRIKNGKYLLQHRDEGIARDPGMFTCFGGGREGDESPEACVIRELGEETGISVEHDQLNYLGSIASKNTPGQNILIFEAVVDTDDYNVVEGQGGVELSFEEVYSSEKVTYFTKEAFDLLGGRSIRVFTTRPDTLFGVTYVVLAPEHKLVSELTTDEQKSDVEAYLQATREKSERERQEGEGKEKTGVFTGGFAVHPLTGEKVPVWVGDYVLGSYGTGAVMAVPAHDERDFEFAKKYNLPVKAVVYKAVGSFDPKDFDPKDPSSWNDGLPFTDDGVLVNSGEFDGMSSEEARKAITAKLEEKKVGEKKVTYRLRDWVFSRQRYWGEPFPLVWVKGLEAFEEAKQGDLAGELPEKPVTYEKDGEAWVALPIREADLPLTLPEVEDYAPAGDGKSALAKAVDWVNIYYNLKTGETRPAVGELEDGWVEATRETDTMPNWAGSSWYFLRYLDPHNDETFASKEKLDYWMPVTLYNGGMEHTTLHLLYSRFWNQFLFDRGHLSSKEPYARRTSHGLILAEDGEKMSKSRGNVVNPDEIVQKYGADTLRVYELFIGPFAEAVPWSEAGVSGVRRFLDRVSELKQFVAETSTEEVEKALHKAMAFVYEAIDDMRFNTAVAELMKFVNTVYKEKQISKTDLQAFLQVLNLFAPHVTNELYAEIGGEGVLEGLELPKVRAELLKDDTMEIAVQVNGKLRASIVVSVDAEKEAILALALQDENVQKFIEGEVKKEIYVPGRLVNFVV